jgi:hypothetical protein
MVGMLDQRSVGLMGLGFGNAGVSAAVVVNGIFRSKGMRFPWGGGG